jgi:hypothetical protein
VEMSRTLSEVKNALKSYETTALADGAATLAEVAESLVRTASVLKEISRSKSRARFSSAVNTHDMPYHPVSDRMLHFRLMIGEVLGDHGILVRAHHQDRAGSVADNRIGNASVDDPLYPVAASTPHDDQVRFQLLGQAHDL